MEGLDWAVCLQSRGDTLSLDAGVASVVYMVASVISPQRSHSFREMATTEDQHGMKKSRCVVPSSGFYVLSLAYSSVPFSGFLFSNKLSTVQEYAP